MPAIKRVPVSILRHARLDRPDAPVSQSVAFLSLATDAMQIPNPPSLQLPPYVKISARKLLSIQRLMS